MRISDWSSDVCSSDLGERCCRGARLAMYAERSAGEGCEDIPGETEHREDKGTGETRRCCPEAAEDGERLLRSEEHTSELQSLMRISYAVFCLKKKTQQKNKIERRRNHHKRTNAV